MTRKVKIRYIKYNWLLYNYDTDCIARLEMHLKYQDNLFSIGIELVIPQHLQITASYVEYPPEADIKRVAFVHIIIGFPKGCLILNFDSVEDFDAFLTHLETFLKKSVLVKIIEEFEKEGEEEL